MHLSLTTSLTLISKTNSFLFPDRPHSQSILVKPTSKHFHKETTTNTKKINKYEHFKKTTKSNRSTIREHNFENIFSDVSVAPSCNPPVVVGSGGKWRYAPQQTLTCPPNQCTIQNCPAGYVFNASANDTCKYRGTCKKCTNANNSGQYCPPKSALAIPCPEGKYCPNFGLPRNCTEGHYCPRESAAPIPCQWGFKCQPDGLKVGWEFFVIIIAVLIFAIILLFIAVRWRNTRKKRAIERINRRVNAEKLVYDLRVALGGPHDSISTMKGMTQSFSPIRVTFEKLGLTLKKNDKRVLDNVSGSIAGGAMVAIMGGSGCGKTTFLNVLCGRAYYGNPDGDVFLNNQKVNMEKIRSSVGFVPQDDVMFDELSVYDNIYYSARLRLSSRMDNAKILDVVDDVIMLFDLEEIQGTIVGSPEKRGISGGQKKRVNIAMEVVSYPRLLFLDEPTSGLDSTSAMQVMRCLSRLRCLGITVVAVIHQPRYSVFRTFSGVLLLGKGGRPVYFGPTGQVQNYFESLGYEVPEGENIADWFIDIVSGSVDRYDDNGNIVPTSVDDLILCWRKHFEPEVDYAEEVLGNSNRRNSENNRNLIDMHDEVHEHNENELWNDLQNFNESIVSNFHKKSSVLSVKGGGDKNLSKKEVNSNLTQDENSPQNQTGNKLVSKNMQKKFVTPTDGTNNNEKIPNSAELLKEAQKEVANANFLKEKFLKKKSTIKEDDVYSENSDEDDDEINKDSQKLLLSKKNSFPPSRIQSKQHSVISHENTDPKEHITESICIVLEVSADEVRNNKVKLYNKDLRTLFVEVGLYATVDDVNNIVTSLGNGRFIPVSILLGGNNVMETDLNDFSKKENNNSEKENKNVLEDFSELQPDPKFLTQIYDLFAREMSLFDPVFYSISVIGIAFSSYIVTSFAANNNSFATIFLFSIIASVMPMDLFMKYETMWARETLAGALPVPYWFVKMLRGLIDAIMMTVAWVVPWYYLSGPVYNLGEALLVYFLICYFSTGYAHLFSVLIPRAMALLISVMFAAMFASVFGGINPVYRNMNTVQKIMSHFGQGVYAFDMLNILTILKNPIENRPARIIETEQNFGSLWNRLDWIGFVGSLCMLIGWGTLLRVFVLVILILKKNNWKNLKECAISMKRCFYSLMSVPGYVLIKPFRTKKNKKTKNNASMNNSTFVSRSTLYQDKSQKSSYQQPISSNRKIKQEQALITTPKHHTIVPNVSQSQGIDRKELLKQKSLKDFHRQKTIQENHNKDEMASFLNDFGSQPATGSKEPGVKMKNNSGKFLSKAHTTPLPPESSDSVVSEKNENKIVSEKTGSKVPIPDSTGNLDGELKNNNDKKKKKKEKKKKKSEKSTSPKKKASHLRELDRVDTRHWTDSE